MTNIEIELERTLRNLKIAIAESSLTQAEIERRAGWSPRYLSRILHGKVDLKHKHTLMILASIGENIEMFYNRFLEEPARLNRHVREDLVNEVLDRLAERSSAHHSSLASK